MAGLRAIACFSIASCAGASAATPDAVRDSAVAACAAHSSDAAVVSACSLLLAALHLSSSAAQQADSSSAAGAGAGAGLSSSAAAGAGAGAGTGVGAGSTVLNVPLAPAALPLLCLAPLPRCDVSQLHNAAVLCAAARGDAASINALPVAAGQKPVDWLLATLLAAAGGQAEAIDAILDHLADDGEVQAAAASAALTVCVARQQHRLAEHLMADWHADPRGDDASAFWIAAQQGNAAVVANLLSSPALRYPLLSESAGSEAVPVVSCKELPLLLHLLESSSFGSVPRPQARRPPVPAFKRRSGAASAAGARGARAVVGARKEGAVAGSSSEADACALPWQEDVSSLDVEDVRSRRHAIVQMLLLDVHGYAQTDTAAADAGDAVVSGAAADRTAAAASAAAEALTFITAGKEPSAGCSFELSTILEALLEDQRVDPLPVYRARAALKPSQAPPLDASSTSPWWPIMRQPSVLRAFAATKPVAAAEIGGSSSAVAFPAAAAGAGADAAAGVGRELLLLSVCPPRPLLGLLQRRTKREGQRRLLLQQLRKSGNWNCKRPHRCALLPGAGDALLCCRG